MSGNLNFINLQLTKKKGENYKKNKDNIKRYKNVKRSKNTLQEQYNNLGKELGKMQNKIKKLKKMR